MSSRDDYADSAAPGTEDLNQLIYQDDLTRTFNRRFFYKYLKEEIAWSSPGAGPVSLLMIDLDHFKGINDRYGHLEGDNALVHVSKIFRREVGERGHVVRYAGDEFSILLPGCAKEEGAALAKRILARIAGEGFRIESAEQPLTLGLSIGVSAFPEDARDPKLFIEEADQALYASKRKGRNRVTLAGRETRTEAADFHVLDVFPCRRTLGRDRILEMFRGVLDTPRWLRNTLALVRGGPGMGKSRVLREVAVEGEARELAVVSHACLARDAEQPFEFLGRALAGFLGGIPREHRPRGLSEGAAQAIRTLIPGLLDDPQDAAGGAGGTAGAGGAGEEPAVLAGRLLEGSLVLLRRVAAGRPLLLLADDLHFADAPSLDLLGRMLRSKVVPLVVAGTYRERDGKQDPLVLSRLGLEPGRKTPSLSLVESRLASLSPADVSEMVRAIFDGIRAPRTLVHRLWDLTRGNPLHVEEILKWLVQNDYVTRTPQGWRVGEIPWDELPGTLEEAVRGHLEGIDVETKEVITNAAALGSLFDLEAIREVSDKGTGEVLEILDRGADASIIRPARPLDDERFEFLSSYTREIRESDTDEKRLREIHERIAGYEERRHEGNLQRVYGRLHYHYDRSNNQEKASFFRGLARGHWGAAGWTPAGVAGEPPSPVRRARARIREADTPLTAHEMGLMRNVLRFFAATLKNRLLYPPGSRIIGESTRDLFQAMQEVFRTCRVFTLSLAGEEFLINGVKIDPRSLVAGNREFMDLLEKYSIQSITLTRDVEQREVEGFRDLMYLRSKEGDLDPDFWDRHLDDKEIRNLSVDQRVYVVAGSESGGGGGRGARTRRIRGPAGTGAGGARGRRHPRAAPRTRPGSRGFSPSRSTPPSRGGGAGAGGETGPLDEFLVQVLGLLESGTPREKEMGAQLFREFMERLGGLRDRERVASIAERLTARLDRRIPQWAFGPIARVLSEAAREFLKRGDHDVASRIVRYLGDRVSRRDGERGVAREARRALDDVIRSGAFDLVIADLTSDDPRRQGRAREVLLGFHDLVVDPLIRVVKETEDYRTRKFTSLILHELGDRAVKQLKRELRDSTEDEEYRRILGILDTFPEDFEEQLLAALCHGNPAIRTEAAKLLRKIRGDIHRILLDVLRAGTGPAATEAMAQLGRLKSAAAVEPILEKLRQDGVSDPVLYEGCMALGRIGDPRAVDFLRGVLAEGRIPFLRRRRAGKVRFAAAWALARIGGEEALEVLRKACRDRDSDIRALATRALK